MNWREVFKPTIIKIILFLLIPSVYVESAVGCGAVIGTECSSPEIGLYPLLLLLIPIFQFFASASGPFVDPLTYIPIIPMFGGIVLSYLIACIIVYVFRKVKNRF